MKNASTSISAHFENRLLVLKLVQTTLSPFVKCMIPEKVRPAILKKNWFSASKSNLVASYRSIFILKPPVTSQLWWSQGGIQSPPDLKTTRLNRIYGSETHDTDRTCGKATIVDSQCISIGFLSSILLYLVEWLPNMHCSINKTSNHSYYIKNNLPIVDIDSLYK